MRQVCARKLQVGGLARGPVARGGAGRRVLGVGGARLQQGSELRARAVGHELLAQNLQHQLPQARVCGLGGLGLELARQGVDELLEGPRPVGPRQRVRAGSAVREQFLAQALQTELLLERRGGGLVHQQVLL